MHTRSPGPEQAEIGTSSHSPRGEMHDVGVGNIGVCEHHIIDAPFSHDGVEFGLGTDLDPVRISPPGELGRIRTVVDVGDLRSGEGNDFDLRIVSKHDVERVEVSSAGARDQHSSHGCSSLNGQ